MAANRCIFCDIITGDAPALKIMEDDLSMVILDIHPYARGHCLVIPKRHVPWWHKMSEEETISLFLMTHKASNKMLKALNPEFVCLYSRGRRIPHTHIFLIPTRSGDVLDRFFNTLEVFQESPEQLVRLKDSNTMKETADLLRGVTED
jgi:histidine triad (HIT) family protein